MSKKNNYEEWKRSTIENKEERKMRTNENKKMVE